MSKIEDPKPELKNNLKAFIYVLITFRFHKNSELDKDGCVTLIKALERIF